MCRSRRELSNAYFLAKFGFDTADNGPCKVCPLSAYRSPRYSTTLTELIADENAAQKAHEELLRTNEQFRKDTTQTKQAKETEKRQKTERLGNARVELAANRQELAEVVQYIADLRPSCDDIRTTFEERKKRREAEIAALKETLAVLEDPSMMR